MADASFDSGPSPTTPVEDVATDSATAPSPVDATPADLTGVYFGGCLPALASGDASRHLLLRVEVATDPATGRPSFTVAALSKTATTLDPSLIVGAALHADSVPVSGGSFEVRFGNVSIPATGNRMSANDLSFTNFRFVFAHADGATMCAELDGELTAPFSASLDDRGDICILKRWKDGAPLPEQELGSHTYYGYALADFRCP